MYQQLLSVMKFNPIICRINGSRSFKLFLFENAKLNNDYLLLNHVSEKRYIAKTTP